MNDYEITWEIDPKGNGYGELCKVAKWIVGSVFYSCFVSRDDPKKYTSECRLPGIKSLLGNYETIDSAKEMVEKAVHHWFRTIFDTKKNT